jgi:hypothetical protein
MLLEAPRLEAGCASQEVDTPPVPAQHAGGRAGVAIVERGDQRRDRARVGPHVIVEEHEDLPGCHLDPGVVAAREAEVRREGNEPHAREEPPHQIERAVRGTVVDENQFEPLARILAGLERREAGGKMSRPFQLTTMTETIGRPVIGSIPCRGAAADARSRPGPGPSVRA